VLKFPDPFIGANFQNKKPAAGIAFQEIQGHNHWVVPLEYMQIEFLSYHIAGSQSGGTLYRGLPFNLSGLETSRRVLPATSITSRCFWHSTIFQSAVAVAERARAWFFFGTLCSPFCLSERNAQLPA
jgi:hypothetical protein